MGFKLGMSGKLYYNSGGVAGYAAPVWVPFVQAKDVAVPIEDGEVELNSRASTFEMVAQGLRKFGMEFSMIYDPSMSDVMYILGAMWNRTAVDVLALDGPISGVTVFNYGWRQVGCVTKLGKTEALTEGQKYDFAIKPTLTSTLHEPTPAKSDANGNIAVWNFS